MSNVPRTTSVANAPTDFAFSNCSAKSGEDQAAEEIKPPPDPPSDFALSQECEIAPPSPSQSQDVGAKSRKSAGRPRVVFSPEEAISLRASGLSWSQVARKLGIGITTVRRACNGGSQPCQNS